MNFLEEKEKKGFINMLIYRSWHRGCKEIDILLGNFAKGMINTLTNEEILIYKDLIEEEDLNIYEWILNEDSAFDIKYKDIIFKIRQFNLIG